MKRQRSDAVNRRHGTAGSFPCRAAASAATHGSPNAAAARPAFFRQVIHRFNDGGADAVTWYPYYCHRGGPREVPADVTEQVAEVALSPPKQLIGRSVWSLPKLYFTPAGASWLNRIGCHFTALRTFALDNTDYRTHDDMRAAAIDGHLDWRNGQRETSMTNWRLYRRQHKQAG